MAKVYVSSTVADLQQERQAVYEWLRKARHQAVDSYPPDSDPVLASCLADVDTCGVYVLILGHRYGFQPAEDNPDGLSITQLEFRRAGESGIPRIALLRTGNPAPVSPTRRTSSSWPGCWRSGRRSPARSGPRSSPICTAWSRG